MLQTLHASQKFGLPVYGMNRGTVGFLMNRYDEDNLRQRVAGAEETLLRPLHMSATDADGKTHEALAINEVSLLRMTAPFVPLKSRNRSKIRCWHFTLCSTSSRVSSWRSALLPLGSPIRPVPPPETTIGRCPARCRCASSNRQPKIE